jgi:hypothetical protein
MQPTHLVDCLRAMPSLAVFLLETNIHYDFRIFFKALTYSEDGGNDELNSYPVSNLRDIVLRTHADATLFHLSRHGRVAVAYNFP